MAESTGGRRSRRSREELRALLIQGDVPADVVVDIASTADASGEREPDASAPAAA